MMFINGQFTKGKSNETIPVINPATEEIIAETPRGTPEDAAHAVSAAKAALPIWSQMPAGERAAMLHKAADGMRAHHDSLVRLLTQEEGKPLPENEEELWWSEETFDYYAELGRHQRGDVLPAGANTQINFTLKEPWGVVACIIPWNYPILLLTWKLAPALAAGNTVVIKPSKYTPLTTLEMVRAAFQHFPPGVVNVLTGYGPEIGEPLLTHPDVDMIAITGSLAVGQRVIHQASPLMKKLHLELGGKDPMVIAPDIEIDTAVRALSYAALINTGQVCTSTERVYVHQSIFAQFSEELSDFVSKLRLGNGLESSTDIGPMIRPKFRAEVDQQVQESLSQGAQILTGGRIPEHLQRGYFYEPTVMINVDHSMRIMREETFGPIIPLMAYKNFDEAIQLANDNPYGLGASLMSHDVRLVKRFYEGVKAGTVWINDPLTDNFAGPFGGMKMSGMGRELGQVGYDEFCQLKHIHWDVEGKIQDYWFPY